MDSGMKRILVTGANGYVARAIINKFNNTHEVNTITRSDIDLTDSKQVDEYFLFNKFDVVIHCAVKGGSRLEPETMDMLDANLKMYYNLLRHKDKFTKFIHIGSGAELYAKHTPYGLSKHVIRASMSEKDNFYNLRIFGVFDENELDTRFIKSNIKKYINHESIEIHQMKKMDFIYMGDFLKIVDRYINDDDGLPKELNCVYKEKVNLLAIACNIVSLSDYSVAFDLNHNNIMQDYIGEYDEWLDGLDLIGLDAGIQNVYEKLKG